MAIHVGFPDSAMDLAKTISEGYVVGTECEGSPSCQKAVYHRNYTNGLWYTDDSVFVPAAARDTIMQFGHASAVAGHFGAKKSIEFIKRTY